MKFAPGTPRDVADRELARWKDDIRNGTSGGRPITNSDSLSNAVRDDSPRPRPSRRPTRGDTVNRGLTSTEEQEGVGTSDRAIARDRAREYSLREPEQSRDRPIKPSSRSATADEDIQRARRDEEKNRA